MEKLLKEFYDSRAREERHLLRKISELDGKIVIVGSAALFVRGLQSKLPGDIDFAVDRKGYEEMCNLLYREGATVWLDHPNSTGFDLRRQFKLNGHKIDLFIVGESFNHYSKVGALFNFATPEIVWAARGYYASKGSRKYQDQLIGHGFWTEDRRPKPALGAHVDKAVWWLGGILRKLKRKF